MQRQVFSRGPAEVGIVDGRPTVRGECDLSNADELESWLASFGTAAIDVDLSDVTFFGATAFPRFSAAR